MTGPEISEDGAVGTPLPLPPRDPFVLLSLKVAEGVEQCGNALARLGSWMRDRLLPAPMQAQGSDQAAAAGAKENGGRRRPVDAFIGSVMVVAVAVFCVIVLRKPAVLGRLFRRARAA